MRVVRTCAQATAGRVGLRPLCSLIVAAAPFCIVVTIWILAAHRVTAIERAPNGLRGPSLLLVARTGRVITATLPSDESQSETGVPLVGADQGVFHRWRSYEQAALGDLARRLPKAAAMKRSSDASTDAAWIGGIAALASLATGLGVFFAVRRHGRRSEAASASGRVDEEGGREARRLGEQHTLFGMALDNMNEGLLMFDRADRLLLANAAVLRIFELRAESIQPGMAAVDFIKAVADAGNVSDHLSAVTDFYLRLVRGNVPAKFIRTMPDGRQLAGNFVPYDDGWLITYEDMTELRRADERIAHMAHHDALTGLPNRVMLRTRTEEALAAVPERGPFAIFCLDLDHFKAVNDTLGPPAGDKLLCEVAKRIRSVTRPSDIVARLGGDEFAVVVSPAGGGKGAIAALATRLVEAIGAPFEIDAQVVFAGASIGVAIACIDGADPDTLMKNADMALYRAKSEGRGRFAFFEPAMEQQVAERQRVARELRAAMSADGLELYYQPIVKCSNRKVVGFEALMRWNHPMRGMVSPTEFISIAEENGLIGDIGAWALNKACVEASGWPESLKVAVNLSPVQFRGGNLVHTVAAALKASGLAASRLELEITESAVMQDTDATIVTLGRLKALGVRIAMDDFGTGYSSLAYLQKFPFDKVKIDRAFVRDIGQTTNLTIVRAVANIAASLGIITLAEGVETEEQFRRVADELCDEVQGFLFSEPRPAGEVMAMLARAPPMAAADERIVEQRIPCHYE